MKSKFLSMLLLTIIIFNMTGFFVVFKIEQYRVKKSIKKQIEAGIPNDKLRFFNFSQKEYNKLEWEDEGNEFRLKNNMYDVVRVEKLQDSIRVYCVNDQEESAVFVRLCEMIQNKMNQESTNPNSPLNKALKITKLIYVSEEYTYKLNNYSTQITSTLNDFNVDFYTSPFLKNETPPPNNLI